MQIKLIFTERLCTWPHFESGSLWNTEVAYSHNFKTFLLYCPRRDFAQKAKSRGGTLVTRAYKVLTVEIYSHTVNIEKISICLNRGREESVGNNDVSIVCACKYEMVGMT